MIYWATRKLVVSVKVFPLCMNTLLAGCYLTACQCATHSDAQRRGGRADLSTVSLGCLGYRMKAADAGQCGQELDLSTF